MKMVKSLLLGSAAGLMAVAGAQAADLPVKAKAVEYVKICSLYGVGYYYIPGTDTCIKIGGYVRFESYHNEVGGHYADRTPGGFPAGYFTRGSNTFGMQARFRLTGDIRTQTEYGTLRAYFAFGVNALNMGSTQGANLTTNAVAMERAFIQFAGFTIGRSDTFFAFYNGAAYGLVPMFTDGSSGPSGHNVFAYTWQFGNGLSASLSAEDSAARIKPVVDLSATDLFSGVSDRSGTKVPDIVGNLRVDQAWGSAQIMGGLAQVSSQYFAGAPAGACLGNDSSCGHNSDKWGWGVGAGLTLKMPWDAKDTLSGVIAYAKGATGFVTHANGQNFVHKQGVATGVMTDAVFANPGVIAGYDGGLELTEAWGGTIAFEHYWTPSLRTSWVFGYIKTEYSDTAKALIARGGACDVGSRFTAVTSCDPDYSYWRLASRTMWNPVANLDIGVEVAYNKVDTAFGGAASLVGANGLAPGVYAVEDQSYWSGAIRVQRSFWP